jgi:hypothetical protein
MKLCGRDCPDQGAGMRQQRHLQCVLPKNKVIIETVNEKKLIK